MLAYLTFKSDNTIFTSGFRSVYTGIIQTSLVFLGDQILSNPLNRTLNLLIILNFAIIIEYQYKKNGLGKRIFDMKYDTK